MTIIDYLASLQISDLFYYAFVPFILIFTIFFGVLSSLGVFDKRVSMILSLCLSVVVASTDGFITLSIYMAQMGAFVSFAVFAIVFFFGVTMWGWGQTKDIYTKSLDLSKKIRHIDERLQKEWKEYDKSRSEYKRAAIYRRIKDLEKQKEALEAREARRIHRR